MDVGLRGNRSAPYLLVTLMAVGMSLVWYSTVWSAGLIAVSFQYTADARNFARGNGFSLLYLWSDRTGYEITEFEQLKETGTDREVLLVIFHHAPPTGKRLDELTSGLKLLGEDQVVSIYALSPG